MCKLSGTPHTAALLSTVIESLAWGMTWQKEDEPQRHRDTEKKKTEKKNERLPRNPGNQEKKEVDLSSFLVSWVP
jgi:hypothetical protein